MKIFPFVRPRKGRPSHCAQPRPARDLRVDGQGQDGGRNGPALPMPKGRAGAITGATLDDGDASTRKTCIHQWISATKANVIHTGTTSRAGSTEPRQGTCVLTFTDYATTAQSYTGTCVFIGTRSTRKNGKISTEKPTAIGIFSLIRLTTYTQSPP